MLDIVKQYQLSGDGCRIDSHEDHSIKLFKSLKICAGETYEEFPQTLKWSSTFFRNYPNIYIFYNPALSSLLTNFDKFCFESHIGRVQ